jgi:hypothetical protein
VAFWPTCFQIPDRRPPWQWAAEKVRLKNSPFGKFFLPDLTPWLKEIIEEFTKNQWEEITAQSCVQGCKSQGVQVMASWAMRFAPGPMMINCQTDDDAKDFARERFNPMIESVPEIAARLPVDRSKKSQCSISLSDMFVLIQGANENNLQSKSIRWLFNDEVAFWAKGARNPGLLDHARKRTTQYWNRRRVNVSTAGEKGCDLDMAFEAGDKREWHLACPDCGQLNLPLWERVKWPKDGTVEVPDDKLGTKTEPVKFENGDWNFKAIKHGAWFECAHCKKEHKHTEEAHRIMNAGAKYIATNPNPTPGWISFRWNALCLSPSVCSWGDLAVEWLKAEAEFAKGNEAPRKEFIQKRLAESYDPNRYISFTKLPTIKIDGQWPLEKLRAMTVDVQETEFWILIIAFSEAGDDLTLWAGKAFSWAEVKGMQEKWGVASRVVGVDCGFDTRKVYEECARNGWTAFRGEDRKEFTLSRKGKTYMLPYSWPPAKGDPMMGTQLEGRAPTCPVIRWSNPTIKDISKRRRDGQTKTKSMVAEGVGDEFSQHMFSEYRKSEIDKRGNETSRWYRIGKRPNHLWDCYNMAITLACLAKIIGDRPDDEGN